jgi:ABC-2 type transport system permease protein
MSSLREQGAFAPSPAPARAGQMILTQTRFEIGASLRNGEQLLLTLVIPVVVLVALAHAPASLIGAEPVIDAVAPGVFALAVMSTAFTGLAIATAFERRYGVLRFLGSTPLGTDGFLTAKTLGVLVVEVIQCGVLGLVAGLLGWSPRGSWPLAVIVLLVGTATFSALGLLLAGTLRAEGTLAVANLIYLVLLGLGGVVIPASRFPGGLSDVISLLPSSALGDGMRLSLTQGQFPWSDVIILLVWLALGVLGVKRWFNWSP